MALFPTFFLGNIGQEKVFYDIPHRKNAFVAYKNKKFKPQKNDIFPKGLAHGFGPKMALFPTSFTIFYIDKTPFKPIETKSSKVEKLAFFQRG